MSSLKKITLAWSLLAITACVAVYFYYAGTHDQGLALIGMIELSAIMYAFVLAGFLLVNGLSSNKRGRPN